MFHRELNIALHSGVVELQYSKNMCPLDPKDSDRSCRLPLVLEYDHRWIYWGGEQSMGSPFNWSVSDKVALWLWLPVVVFLALPSFAFVRGPLLRHLRRKTGCCLKCGYDLTGNVSGVCSECGERV